MMEDMENINNGRMVGKSEVVWAIMEQMDEINPSWACEDVWSTLRAQMDMYLSDEDKRKLRTIDMKVRELIKKMPRGKNE